MVETMREGEGHVDSQTWQSRMALIATDLTKVTGPGGDPRPGGQQMQAGIQSSDVQKTNRKMDVNETDAPKPKTKITEARREYLKEYYRQNREKFRLYQRRYNMLHRRKSKADNQPGFNKGREIIRTTFTPSDIIKSSPEKAAKIIQMVLQGERLLVG